MILVTGATGNVGHNLVTALHTAGQPVRALARHPHTCDLPTGVEVVAGDLTDPATLCAALRDVQSAFLFPLFGRITPFLDAAHNHQLGNLVMLSSAAVTFGEPGWIGQQHQLLEEQVQGSGIPAAFVRPDVFMANDLAWATTIRSSRTVRLAYPEAATAPIDERDIAAVAAQALIDKTTGTAYEITGPESLSQADRVRTIAAVLGHPIDIVELSPDEASIELQRTMPAEAVAFLLDTLRGRGDTPARTTDTVHEVTGCAAHSYRQWAADRRHDLTTNP